MAFLFGIKFYFATLNKNDKMSKKLKIFVGFLAIFIVFMNVKFIPSNILSWDVFGYYLYLPLTFIYHDLGLQNDAVILKLIETYHSTATFYQIVTMPDGISVMKYSMGMAILYSPFFFIGWLVAHFSSFPVDGLSAPFQYAIFSGGILYSLIGLWFTAKVLNKFFKEKVVMFTLLLIVFATNYLVHITMYGQNAMSQNYLFTGYALVLWLTIRWHEGFKPQFIIALSLVAGLMILSRPTEIVVLIIPLLWNVTSLESLVKKRDLLWRYKFQIMWFALIIAGIGMMQLGYWKIYSGKFLFNSYGANAGEGLDLLRPHTWKFLFSYRKGWLVFTPIMSIAIAGFYLIYRNNRPIFYALFTYFVFNLYLVSSWTTWWYAQSFSQRAMVSSYPIMAIGLGYFMDWAFKQKGIKHYLISGFLVLLVSFNLFQVLQFHRGVLHGDRMTEAYYWAVFGKLSVTDEDRKLLLIDRGLDGKQGFVNEQEYVKTADYALSFDDSAAYASQISFTGCCSFELNSEKEFSPYIEKTYSDLTLSDHAWVRVTANVFVDSTDIENPFSLVAHFSYNGYPYKYRTIEAKTLNLVPGKWNKIQMDYLTPEVRTAEDKLRVLVWYRGNKKLYVDDLRTEVYEKIAGE
tara:strand:- start:84454 stop:86343 length:1890 start_codon:yes stop_codon:yes gene_type:complete